MELRSYILLLLIGFSFFAVFLNLDSDTNKGYDFYDSHYSYLVAKKGVHGAFFELKKNYDIDLDTQRMCHQITHVIGRNAAMSYKNVGEAFRHGDSFCWSGYYHGVMEGIVQETEESNLAYDIDIICSTIQGKEKFSFDYYNCVHGLGHGIMYIKGNDIFDSLKSCDDLNGSWEQNSCYGGVFMENIITDGKNHFTKYLSDDPYFPCNAVEERYAYQCYLMQTSRMLEIVNWNFGTVFELCSQLDKKFEDICYQSLGRDASGYTKSNAEKTKKICLLGKDLTQRKFCVIGVAKDFVAYYHSDAEAKSFCSILPSELKSSCHDAVKEMVDVL